MTTSVMKPYLGFACVLLALLPGLVHAQNTGRAGLAAADEEQETVIVRRLNDSVGVRFVADKRERVLYFFDPRAELVQGDEVEQGPSGQSTVVLSEGGLIQMFAAGHMVIDALGREQGGELVDVLRFPLLNTVEVTSLDRKLICMLPGDIQAELLGGRITIKLVPGRLRIRNDGGSSVRVRGTMTQESDSTTTSGEGVLVLGRGDEVALPYFKQRNRQLGESGGYWAGLSLRDLGEVAVEQDGQYLVVTSAVEDGRDTAFTVGGVRGIIEVDSALVFERHRRGAPAVMEFVEALEIAAPAAVPRAVEPIETPPAGMFAIELSDYIEAVKRGVSIEELAELDAWVPPSVLAEFDRLQRNLLDQQGGAEEDNQDSDFGAEPPAADEDQDAEAGSDESGDPGESP